MREYLDAIARGDATEANRIVDVQANLGTPLSESEGMLLSDEALSAATERITVESLKTIERGEDRAKVRAKIALAGEAFTHDFELQGTPGSIFVPDQWQLSTPLIGLAAINVTLATSGLEEPLDVQIGESTVVASATVAPAEVRPVVAMLYPAIYSASVEGGEFLEAAEGELRVDPIAGDASDRLVEIATSALLGSFSDSDLELALPYSARFTEEITAQGLAFAQLCATEGDIAVTIGVNTNFCHALLATQAVDVCQADPDARLGELNGRTFQCEYYRSVDPYHGEVSVELVSPEVTPEEGATDAYRVGTYRFTEVASGRSFDRPIQYAYLKWDAGQPIIRGGDFDLDE